MTRHGVRNLELVVSAISALGDLAHEVVLVGGAATALLITDPAAPDVRPTLDVDVIVEVLSRREHYEFCERLRDKGFVESGEEGVICRWKKGGVILDVMPTNEDILGFANRWYPDTVRNAQRVEVDGKPFWAVTGPYFLGTKWEAFQVRGAGEYDSSHDMEDIIAVLDGRAGIVDEIKASEAALQEYLAECARLLLEKDATEPVITCHLPGDQASQQRARFVRERLRSIAAVGVTPR
ncbi:hypothetical protein [Fundidesulfovibrio agrisoli]|uniref:hypothetical protein n=1 Tax=Fundidesulfovibrio agrisoli TaxID=2922717 RepID=UPI001FADBED0|nr:hypothetical protein [Fundidesulfovibrio agrisoli]